MTRKKKLDVARSNSVNCESKATYDEYKDAHARVREINKGNKEAGRKEYLRIYTCQSCGKYHFTSLTKDNIRYRVDPKFRSEKNAEIRLRRESDYWNKRFGIKGD